MESKVDDHWFTIEQIDRDTFSISEYKHWEETHCYLLCGEECALLMDTGLGVSNIRRIVDSLTQLPVMAVTTHVHWDHNTPGHSPGHCCFYEPERNYLYSGDLIYKGSLDAFYPTTDPQLFYQSIRRIRKYNIKKVLPGHHQLDIPVALIADIEAGFAQLSRTGKLKQGNGLFKFRDFQIHI